VKNVVGAILCGASLIVFSASACSSSSTTSGSGTDDAASPETGTDTDADHPTDSGGTTDTGATDSGADSGGACNDLVNGAPESTSSTIMGDAPTALGGTIADGTYFQTELNVYDPAGPAQAPSPSGLKVTLAIKGNLMTSIQTLPDDSTATFAETFVVSNTDLNRTLTCPKPGPDLQATYSVEGSILTFYETDPGSGLVAASVFKKQ
jgi:hypothetical protein